MHFNHTVTYKATLRCSAAARSTSVCSVYTYTYVCIELRRRKWIMCGYAAACDTPYSVAVACTIVCTTGNMYCEPA